MNNDSILHLNLLFRKFEGAVSSGKHAHKIHTPLHPSYIVKLGFTGVYIIFLFLL